MSLFVRTEVLDHLFQTRFHFPLAPFSKFAIVNKRLPIVLFLRFPHTQHDHERAGR